jgi:hypothetical protein
VIRRLAVAMFFVACSSAQVDGDAYDDTLATGPAAIHPGWFKTPEAITETMTRTWELELTPADENTYLGGLRACLGGVSVTQHGSPLDQPNELFALASNALAAFTAQKLLEKQVAKTAAGELYMFDGLGLADEDDGCYADDTKDWCDGADGIVVGSLTEQNVDPKALSRSVRKRLMHKMQAIGEFFLMAIDDRTTMAGGKRHAPAFLLDDVFLPKLSEATLSAAQEQKAWEEVVTTILLGGYYFDLPAGSVR